jgi:hypothetical protein
MTLPNLPLGNLEPDGTELYIEQTSMGRWVGKIWDDGIIIDVFRSEDVSDLLRQVAEDYPHTSFDGEHHDDGRRESGATPDLS